MLGEGARGVVGARARAHVALRPAGSVPRCHRDAHEHREAPVGQVCREGPGGVLHVIDFEFFSESQTLYTRSENVTYGVNMKRP